MSETTTSLPLATDVSILNSNSVDSNNSLLFKFAGFSVFIYFFVTVLFIVWFSFSKIKDGKFIVSSPQLILWSALILIIIYIMSSAYIENNKDNKTNCADLTSKIIIIMSILGLITNVYFFQKI